MIGKLAKLAFVLIAACILFPSLAEANGIEDKVLENPAGVNELIVNVVQHGTVWVDGNPSSIMINLTTPQDDHRQDVDIEVSRVKDELGVDIGVIEEDNPENPFSYTISGVVKSRANHLTSLPSSYVIPENVEVYLQATENIQSSDPRFRNLAEEITRNSRDDFEKVAKLALWVYDQMTYDLSYSDQTLDAVTVLENKVGVCAEYTTLFIALARSIGIPTKYVSAHAYGEYGWERHAYAEVYLGKWVPVDPLWLEIGYMDATHIRFGDHADNRVRNKVEVSGYNLKGSPQWLEDEIDLSTVSYSRVEKEEDYELTISSEGFRKGDDGVVALAIVPKEFIVGKITLEPCAGEYDIVDVEDKEKRVLLRPGEKEQVSWKIGINPGLPRNYIFTCPLTLNSRSLALKTINASVNTQYGEREKGKISAKLFSEVLELGDEQTVYIKVEDLGRGSWIGIIAGEEHEKYQLDTGNLVTSFKFIPKELGEGEVMVYTSEGEAVNLGYRVESTLSLAIEDFSVPEYLKVGESKNISASVVNKGKSEESVHLNLKVEGEDNLENFMLKDTHAVSLPVSFQSPGIKTIKLEVSGAGTDLSETRVIEVYEEPVTYYDTVYEDGKGILKLDVKNSRIKNVTIRIGEQEKKADEIFGEKEIEFTLAPGEYAMTIECSDIGGKPYEISETIEFHEKNIFEMIMDAINGFIEGIMGFFSS
ncbi:MAG: transglutaminase domain-containing protein [Candidatus Aenigmatarchaeota archaeon]|nr:MAG: transglutaminase domain-containing protein [Candidatus Aenigmarchaeota archaeon]